MNLLYLCHRIPYPPDKGDKIRSYHQLAHLASKHRVWCAFFVDSQEDWRYLDDLRSRCAGVAGIPLSPRLATFRSLCGLARGETASEAYYTSRAMRRTLQAWSERTAFDAAVIFSSSMAPYRSSIRAKRFVLDFCDWDSLKWRDYARFAGPIRSALYNLEATRLYRREQRWLREFEACSVATLAEALDRGETPGQRLHVIENGADLGPEPATLPHTREPRIGFVGQMDYPPNVDAVCYFAEAVLPLVQAQVPDARLVIVGRSPHRRVRALAARRAIDVTGPVADVRSHLESFAVSVAPLRIARGIQNKVLEAMAAARPVVLTTKAAQGVGGRDGEHYYLADDPASMSARTVKLLLHPTLRTRIGLAARRFVADSFSWDREMAKFEALVVGTSDAVRGAPAPDPNHDPAERSASSVGSPSSRTAVTADT